MKMKDVITTIGIDMGDKKNTICAVNAKGDVLKKETQPNTPQFARKYYGSIPPCRIVLEAGTHSMWFSEILKECGHNVIVVNPRTTRIIWQTNEKNDGRDAEVLARIANVDIELLDEIQHRSAAEHADLAVIKARDAVVAQRTSLIAHVRGEVKTAGSRIDACDADNFHLKALDQIPSNLLPALEGIVGLIASLTKQIRDYDHKIGRLCEKYSGTQALSDIAGVGPITSLCFVLTVGSCDRFAKSRDVGAYYGLTPRHDQSGQRDKLLGITKSGNEMMRRLLVGCARYILGPFGPDCDLRRFGMKIMERGGKNAKGRAAMAVARKLSVLMHSLLKNKIKYDPFHQENKSAQSAA